MFVVRCPKRHVVFSGGQEIFVYSQNSRLDPDSQVSFSIVSSALLFCLKAPGSWKSPLASTQNWGQEEICLLFPTCLYCVHNDNSFYIMFYWIKLKRKPINFVLALENNICRFLDSDAFSLILILTIVKRFWFHSWWCDVRRERLHFK